MPRSARWSSPSTRRKTALVLPMASLFRKIAHVASAPVRFAKRPFRRPNSLVSNPPAVAQTARPSPTTGQQFVWQFATISVKSAPYI
jgi:hypothetical protein